MRKTFIGLLALSLALAACSPEEVESTSTTGSSTTSSSTTTSSTTTTTIDERPTSLINGLPVDDEENLDRRVLAVKIDNHPEAQPQSGIDQADMVIELLVEGITRFITIWHETDVDYLGPERSGRPTDPTLLQAFNEPTFAISGAQPWVQSIIRSKNVYLIGEVHPATFRISSRSAPHNLYVDTSLLREYADEREYPDMPPFGPIWEFGEMPLTAQAASSVTLDFTGGNVVNWQWDPITRNWLRFVHDTESNTVDQEGVTAQIARPVLVALYVEQYTVYPPSGVSGSPVPGEKTIGSGTAFVFANGRVVEGTWEREEETEWFTLRDEAGNIIPVPPGKVWVSLVSNSTGLTWE
jgi:hypothetical protein